MLPRVKPGPVTCYLGLLQSMYNPGSIKCITCNAGLNGFVENCWGKIKYLSIPTHFSFRESILFKNSYSVFWAYVISGRYQLSSVEKYREKYSSCGSRGGRTADFGILATIAENRTVFYGALKFAPPPSCTL